MPRIADAYLDCAIYLYPSTKDADEGAHIGGSGFVVGAPFEAFPNMKNAGLPIAVTNRHVIETGNTVIRLTTKAGGTDTLDLTDKDWVFHPDGDDLAAAVLAIDQRVYNYRFAELSSFVSRELIKEFNIGPGDDVFLVGRFINHEGKQKNLPTLRFGHIAQMPNEPVMIERADGPFPQESFLVEIRSIGGYSGSPVFVYIPPASIRENVQDWVPLKILNAHGPWLLGIDWGHINDWEPVRNSRGKPYVSRNPAEMQVKLNTGMAAIVPAWKLAEMLTQGEILERRRKIEKTLLEISEARVRARLSGATPDSVPAFDQENNPFHKEDFTRLVGAASKKKPQAD